MRKMETNKRVNKGNKYIYIIYQMKTRGIWTY